MSQNGNNGGDKKIFDITRLQERASQNIQKLESRTKISVMFSENIIKSRLEMLAKDIAHDYAKTSGDLLVISLMKGSFMFTSDLVRALHRHKVKLQLDFITLSSYGKQKESTGHVVIHSDTKEEIAGRKVLIVDDILESGRTLAYAKDLVASRGARDVKIAVLMEKPGKLAHRIVPDYVGFTVPNKFVVGYGLDYANYYRELPFIAAVQEEN